MPIPTFDFGDFEKQWKEVPKSWITLSNVGSIPYPGEHKEPTANQSWLWIRWPGSLLSSAMSKLVSYPDNEGPVQKAEPNHSGQWVQFPSSILSSVTSKLTSLQHPDESEPVPQVEPNHSWYWVKLPYTWTSSTVSKLYSSRYIAVPQWMPRPSWCWVQYPASWASSTCSKISSIEYSRMSHESWQWMQQRTLWATSAVLNSPPVQKPTETIQQLQEILPEETSDIGKDFAYAVRGKIIDIAAWKTAMFIIGIFF